MSNREEKIAWLCEQAVEETPAEVPPGVAALLPGIFSDLLDRMAAWGAGEGEDSDLPVPLRHCQCTSCIIGVAGDEVARLTGDQTYGFG